MDRKTMQDWVARLAERYGWRHLPDRSECLGIHRGLGIHVTEFDGELSFLFFNEHADVGDEILAEFQGFHHCAEAGLPTNWFKGRVEDDFSCVLRLDGTQLGQMGEELFLIIPDVVADDFHEHGGDPEVACQQCGDQIATRVSLVDGWYRSLCRGCWADLHLRAPGGRLARGEAVRWGVVAPLLVICTVAGALVWGALQQPQSKTLGIGLVLLPFGYGVGLSKLVLSVGSGVNLLLRLAIMLSAVMAVLVGNLWGFGVMLAQEQPGLTWGEVIQNYFGPWLRDNWRDEVPFLIGGLVGAWVGFIWLKPHEHISVR
jgi:hypothetical protein